MKGGVFCALFTSQFSAALSIPAQSGSDVLEQDLHDQYHDHLKEILLLLLVHKGDIDQFVDTGGKLAGQRTVIRIHPRLPYMLSVSRSAPLTLGKNPASTAEAMVVTSGNRVARSP